VPKVKVYNMQGEQVGEVELSDSIFGVEINHTALYQVAKMQLANRRQGTASTKGRGEVKGGGRKPWRQKGTGRARHGSIRSPIWVGGGTTFGPTPRSYRTTVPKKVHRLALKSALSGKANDEEILVIDRLEYSAPRTKNMIKLLEKLPVGKKVLLVMDNNNMNVIRSARNIPGIRTIPARQLNVLDILNHDNLIFTKDALQQVEEVFA